MRSLVSLSARQTPKKTPMLPPEDTVIHMDSLSLDAKSDSDAQQAAIAELAASGVNTDQLIRDPKKAGEGAEGMDRAHRADSGEHIDDEWKEDTSELHESRLQTQSPNRDGDGDDGKKDGADDGDGERGFREESAWRRLVE